jgi:hypothetical protein
MPFGSAQMSAVPLPLFTTLRTQWTLSHGDTHVPEALPLS